MLPVPPPGQAIEAVIAQALAEDLTPAGDLTTSLLIEPDQSGNSRIFSRVPGVLAGGVLLPPLFGRLDPRVRVRLLINDGQALPAGAGIARVDGPVAAILTGERVALNLLARLSGIATLTQEFVRLADGKVRIVDTRKTTPGLRALERYAVRCGGGFNHRFNLSDAVLIKDNHLAACGGVAEAVRRIRRGASHTVSIEVEVQTLQEACEAFAAGADILLLDNMNPALLRQVTAELSGKVLLEASGGVTLATIAQVASSGVDYVSIGALTHSATSLDLSLELEARPGLPARGTPRAPP